MIRLSNGHIIIAEPIAVTFFSNTAQVNWVYYPQRKTLLIALPGDELFRSLHKVSTGLLKHRNDKGDRSLSIQELLLDYAIDSTERPLSYKTDETLGILSIYFENKETPEQQQQ